jgi:hypothetical protein
MLAENRESDWLTAMLSALFLQTLFLQTGTGLAQLGAIDSRVLAS